MISLHTLMQTLDDWMRPSEFQDYAPNGLQVEGRDSIGRLALGVTASADVIDQALAWNADALLVHHGYFWRNEPVTLTGMKGARVRRLMKNDMSLLAYHLPLDCHAEFGNNVTLLQHLGFLDCQPITGESGLLWEASIDPAMTPRELGDLIGERLERQPLVVESPVGVAKIRRLIVCTGGAQDYLSRAHRHGADAYLSGEISERTTHEARELGVHYLSSGHHATERYGVQALGQKLSQHFEIEVAFFDDHNPA